MLDVYPQKCGQIRMKKNGFYFILRMATTDLCGDKEKHFKEFFRKY